MPKELPCKQCRGPAKGRTGAPMAIGCMSSSPLIYKCRGCGMVYKLTAQEYNRLPELDKTG